MKIFIDSNQFINDFGLESAPMRYLFHFLNNSGHELILSQLVVEEVENKFRESVSEVRLEAQRVRDRMVRLGLVTSGYEVPAPRRLDLLGELKQNIEYVQIIDYASIPQKEVVERALNRMKPFDSDGRAGYRDCLIWLSLVRFLKGLSPGDEEVIFISNNWKDFYEQGSTKDSRARKGNVEESGRSVLQFHGDLIEDLASVKQRLIPFDSVSAFVDSKVDKAAHAIDHSKVFELFEDFLEEEGLKVLGDLNRRHGNELLKELFGLPAGMLTIINSDGEISEGVEDLCVHLAEPIDKEVFIDCSYDFRRVSLNLYVLPAQYDEHRVLLEEHPSVWEVVRLDEYVAIRIALRAYFSASFTFNPQTRECSGYSLSTFSVR